jgi:excinuclease ABC subunit B
MTASMREASSETDRRRQIQLQYNRDHGIIPETVRKAVHDIVQATQAAEGQERYDAARQAVAAMGARELAAYIKRLEKEMTEAAKRLEFERAAELRDQIRDLRAELALAETTA